MKLTIRKKLFISGAIVVFFIILISITGVTCVQILKRNSNLIAVEYLELECIQDIRFSISLVNTPISEFIIENDPKHHKDFIEKISDAKAQIQSCKTVLSERHSKGILQKIGNYISEVDSIGRELFKIDEARISSKRLILTSQINNKLEKSLDGILELQEETKNELNKYVKINETALLHSTMTIISFGIILTLVVLSGGLIFIKSLNSPIAHLMGTIVQVSKGNLEAKVKVTSRDELGLLAGAFNEMLERIEKVTVSRNYYDNILNSMFNGLIVTDNVGKITSLNESASRFLGKTNDSMLGSSVKKLFNEPKYYDKFIEDAKNGIPCLQTESTFISGSGSFIPVIFAISKLQANTLGDESYVIVFHDLTEIKKIEYLLDQIKKERVVAINEAQEKERLRIATDLHDGLGQILTSISFSVQNLKEVLLQTGSEITEKLSVISDHINLAIAESKRISQNLIPLSLKDFGLRSAITQFLNQITHDSSIRFHFDVFNLEERTDPRLEKALYRICQEAVINILKHSGAKSANIQLIGHETSVVLVVSDDGHGFNYKEPSIIESGQGIGLASIRERVASFGGTFLVNSNISTGTELIIEIPYMKTEI